MSKISQLQAATEVASDDLLEIVDVSDGTMSTTNGTNKKITVASLLTQNSSSFQRLLTKTNLPAGHIAKLAEFTALEGNVAIEIQVSGYANGNSGTSTYRFQGGYNTGGPNGVLPTTSNHAGTEATAARFYRLYPFNDGRGHGEANDTGLATTPWMLMIYHVTHSGTTGGFGVAIVNTSATLNRSFTVTITELRRGMTFTDKTTDATTAFSGVIEANIYSHRNLLVQNRIGIGKVPTTALDVNGTITATALISVNKNIELGSVPAIASVSGTIASTATTTTITGIASTSGMVPGQILTKFSGAGAFGGVTTITSVNSSTQITITSTTANTAGAIVFSVSGATDTTANGGGITLKGATDKTFNWNSSNDSWTSSENLILATGKNFTGNSITCASDSVINGVKIGRGGSSVSNNIAIGQTSLNSNTIGSSNIAIGVNALASNTVSGSNVAIGNNALYSITANSTGNNIAIGNSALNLNTSHSNTAVGNLALTANTTGTYNTAIGHDTLASNTSGADNTAIGQAALSANTTGSDNTAIGRLALQWNSTMGGNTAVGSEALRYNSAGAALPTFSGSGYTPGTYNNITLTLFSGPSPSIFPVVNITVNSSGVVSSVVVVTSGAGFTTYNLDTVFTASIGGVVGGNFRVTFTALKQEGNSNAAVGYQALGSNTVGYDNVAVGYQALSKNKEGPLNTAIGSGALRSTTYTSRSVAIGNEALSHTNYTGINNVAIGSIAGSAVTSGSNNIFIGSSVCSGGTDYTNSGCVVIGASSLTTPSSTSVTNEVTIGNGAGRIARFQGATVTAWEFVSDARDKRNVTDIDLGLDFVNQLQPRKFEWNHRIGESGNGEYSVGFIAQELLEVVENNNAPHTQLVSTSNPDQYTVAQTNLIPVLVNAIKELSTELQSVKAELATLTK